MITLSGNVLEEIRTHGQETYPEECCGALLGALKKGRARVKRVERTANSRRDERRRRFQITPEEYGRVEKLADAEGLALLGFYHSHPDHLAIPSDYDREHALPVFHYLVLAVGSGRPGEITAWVLSEDRRSLDREDLSIQGPGG